MININKSAIVIISLSIFLFIAYNVMTVEAVDLNKEYTWTGPDGHKDKVTLNDFEVEDIPDTCDASEDYTKNKKLCDDLYNMKEEGEESVKKQQQDQIKETCKEVDGKLNKKGECETDQDGPKADKFEKILSEKQNKKQVEEVAEKIAQQDPYLEKYQENKYNYPKPDNINEDWKNTVSEESDDVNQRFPSVTIKDAEETNEPEEEIAADSNEADESSNDVEEEQDEEEKAESDDEQEEESDDGDSDGEESSEE